MLPLIVYNLDEAVQETLLSLLKTEAEAHGVHYQVALSTDSASEVSAATRQNDSIALYILGIDPISGKVPQAAALGREALSRNRDSYTIYVISRREDLEAVATLCQRPYSVLLSPVKKQLASMVFSQMLSDYVTLLAQEDDSSYIVVQHEGAYTRIGIKDILYVEAMDKKLMIYLSRQVLSIYASISAFSEKLQGKFFRSHRSYLVNIDCIQTVNLPGMELSLISGARIPIARSARAEAKGILTMLEGGS